MNTTPVHAETLLHESRIAYIFWDEDSQSVIIRKKNNGTHPEVELLDVPVLPVPPHSASEYSSTDNEWQGVLGSLKRAFDAAPSSN